MPPGLLSRQNRVRGRSSLGGQVCAGEPLGTPGSTESTGCAWRLREQRGHQDRMEASGGEESPGGAREGKGRRGAVGKSQGRWDAKRGRLGAWGRQGPGGSQTEGQERLREDSRKLGKGRCKGEDDVQGDAGREGADGTRLEHERVWRGRKGGDRLHGRGKWPSHSLSMR